jgi:peroxidase
MRLLSLQVVTKFSQIYKTPEDVELYTGGVVERHVQDSVLGPTWWCIAGYQFQNWKRSDRYFYTEGNQPHSFTIRKNYYERESFS